MAFSPAGELHLPKARDLSRSSRPRRGVHTVDHQNDLLLVIVLMIQLLSFAVRVHAARNLEFGSCAPWG